MKHKHYDLIVAWAEGKEIQVRYEKHDWEDLTTSYPGWYPHEEYRIKPEPPKEPQYLYVYYDVNTRKTCMSPSLMQETYQWVYVGKVRVEK